MADERDIKQQDDTLRWIAYFVLAVLPVILLIAGSWNLYVASELGDRNGYSLPDLFKQWHEGLDITREYSQSFLTAMESISSAVLQISGAFITLCMAGIFYFRRKIKKELTTTT
jgi:hypothetical protein